jgi:hypothetical protein
MATINRRKFIAGSTGLLAAGSIAPVIAFVSDPNGYGHAGPDNELNGVSNGEIDLQEIPNFCSHEHWGSIDSIGLAPEQGGFRADTVAGARPLRPTTIWDLILDPYQ